MKRNGCKKMPVRGYRGRGRRLLRGTALALVLLGITALPAWSQETSQEQRGLVSLRGIFYITQQLPLYLLPEWESRAPEVDSDTINDYEDKQIKQFGHYWKTRISTHARWGGNLQLFFHVGPVINLGVEAGASVGFARDGNYRDAVTALLGGEDPSPNAIVDVPVRVILGFAFGDFVLDLYAGGVFLDVDSLMFTQFALDAGMRANFGSVFLDIGYVLPTEMHASVEPQQFHLYSGHAARIGFGFGI